MPPGEELAHEWESYRMVMLRHAMEEEMNIEYFKVIRDTFGAFEQEPTGHIRAGPLSKARREAFIDLVSTMRPFEKHGQAEGEGEDGKPPPSQDINKEREAFVKEYQEWAEKGGPIPVARLTFRDA